MNSRIVASVTVYQKTQAPQSIAHCGVNKGGHATRVADLAVGMFAVSQRNMNSSVQ